ncbi:MAG: hypothetical protein AAGG01_21795, partial [Planctomycetota bacterium]
MRQISIAALGSLFLAAVASTTPADSSAALNSQPAAPTPAAETKAAQDRQSTPSASDLKKLQAAQRVLAKQGYEAEAQTLLDVMERMEQEVKSQARENSQAKKKKQAEKRA